MQTWDKAKPQEKNHQWCCSTCNWYTYTNYFEFAIPVIVCPICGDKVRKFNVYICPTCGKSQGGVEEYNWHTLHHWSTYKPLPNEIKIAIKKYYPEWIKEN